MNEEEIKIKCILPWLAQAGVNLQELQFERTFTIRIGRQTIPMVESHRRDSAGARLDILVRRGDKNLLIVETKAPSLSLTDDDRDQAVSYARLVHPIAPYAVVTNGTEYRLYDSLTKRLIDPSAIKISGFEAALPESDVAEAQSIFLALNRTNLTRFCISQVAAELRLLKGSVTETKKYVPELHVSREKILNQIHEFYDSSLPGLLLVGQSGVGKTCELCSLAESLLERGKPVLFFNGFSLEKDIIDAISKEFSWAFTGTDLPIQIVKRIESFVQGDYLTIMVDAIDEWTFQSRSNHLSALLRAVENRKIKLIMSCKTSAINDFISNRGTPTLTSYLTKRVDVTPFQAKEFFKAVNMYRKAFQFYGCFEDIVLNQARENPFLLRVLFDVAKNSKVKHLTFSSPKFFEEYYKRTVSKTCNMRQAEETLKAIASLLYKHNTDWISENDIRQSLGLRVNETLMEELFEFGILLRSLGDAEEPVIGFYFQQLRDYIIAFKALHFHKKDGPTLKEELKNITSRSMQTDVFTLYYRLASQEHKLIFDSELRANATKYLNSYVSLIQHHFPFLKSALTPRTDGRVGFIAELDLSQGCVSSYGFRPISDTEELVYFVPTQEALGHSNLAYLNGADDMHWRSSSFSFREGIDITTEVVDGELLPQIRELVEKGRLNESNNPDLLTEFIIETIRHNKNIFKPLLTPNQQAVIFPLRLENVLECLQREKLTRHFKDKIIEKKRQQGEIHETWNGTTVSYSYSHTSIDAAEVDQNVEQALVSHQLPNFISRYVDLENLEFSLSSAVNALRRYRTKIMSPLWENLEQTFEPHIRQNDLSLYLSRLYTAFLFNYKALIETNFPTFRSHFKLYQKLPVSVFLVMEAMMERNVLNASTPLAIYFVKAEIGQDVVQVVENVEWKRSGNGLNFVVHGVEYEGIICIKTTAENLLLTTGLKYDCFRKMPLRTLVYSTLLKELSVVEESFRHHVKCDQSHNL